MVTDRLNAIKEQAHAMRACEWANSRERTDVFVQKLAETKKVHLELQSENRELTIRRKARMKEFLAEEAAVFEQQLNELGLAFRKDD